MCLDLKVTCRTWARIDLTDPKVFNFYCNRNLTLYIVNTCIVGFKQHAIKRTLAPVWYRHVTKVRLIFFHTVKVFSTDNNYADDNMYNNDAGGMAGLATVKPMLRL